MIWSISGLPWTSPRAKRAAIWNLFLQSNDGDVDVGESRIDQGFLDWINLMIGERYVVELRWISRKEAPGNFVRDSTEWIMPVRIPNTEQVMSAGRENAANFTIGRVLLREKHYAELAYDRIERAI